ncbi:hypothetical protein R1flu_017091 [Riccia fluitans]|uniref:Uncharacterized protein n=1 Tax=Riccia fluitans TaxID=41844 RepID=A0ABD1YNS1_9MARC
MHVGSSWRVIFYEKTTSAVYGVMFAWRLWTEACRLWSMHAGYGRHNRSMPSVLDHVSAPIATVTTPVRDVHRKKTAVKAIYVISLAVRPDEESDGVKAPNPSDLENGVP